MKWFSTVAAFGAACITAFLIARTGADARAQTRAEAILVCVADDGSLRVPPPQTNCAGGQTSLYLSPDTGTDPKNKAADDPESVRKRIADLEQRVKELEEAAGRGELGSSRVVAPFEVVDHAGKRVFYVEEGSLVAVFNSAGKAVARISASESGGFFTGYSAAGDLSTTVGAVGGSAGVRVLEGSVNRVDLGRDEVSQNYRLKIFGSSGALAAGIGETSKGPGTAFVADTAGDVKASIAVDSQQRGRVSVFNSKYTIASLTQGDSKGGLLLLNNSNGTMMVEAGSTAEGVGVVRAGPEGFKPGLGVLGLPASSITGKAK